MRRVDDVRRDFVANVSPRAQDPGRRAVAAGRGRRGRRRRPGGGAALRRPDAARGDPALVHGQRAHRAVPAAGRRRRCRTPASSRSTRWWPRRSTASVPRPPQSRSTCARPASTASSSTGVRDQLVTALRNLVDNAISYSPERTRVVVSVHDRAATWSRSAWPTRASASRPPTRSGSSSGSTASTRPARAPPAGPGWACRSSSTSAPTTAARSPCGAPRAPGSTFTLRLPRAAGAVRATPSRSPTRSTRAAADRKGGPVTRVLVVEDEESLQRRAVVHAPQGGLRGRASPRPARPRSRSSTATAPTSCCWT